MIAALKCYLAIAAYRVDQSGDTVLSTWDFIQIARLSKPMVFEGLTILEAFGLIQIYPREASNTHAFGLGELTTGFRKVPQDVVAAGLPLIANRGAASLDALKLYLALLYNRNEEDNSTTISHVKLREYTGIRPENIVRAYSVLHTANFVVIERLATGGANGHPLNVYRMRGDFAGRRPRLQRPSEQRRSDRAADRAIPF